MPNPKFWQRSSRKASQGPFTLASEAGLAPVHPDNYYSPDRSYHLPVRSRSQRFSPISQTPDPLPNRRSYVEPSPQHSLNVEELEPVQRLPSNDLHRGFDIPQFSLQAVALANGQPSPGFTDRSEEEETLGAVTGPTSVSPYSPSTSPSKLQDPAALDRFSQRRLQRLNTEQVFRDQRQGGAQGVLSPVSDGQSTYSTPGSSQNIPEGLQQQSASAQPQSQQAPYQNTSSRTSPSSNNLAVAAAPPQSNTDRSPPQHQSSLQGLPQSQQQYSQPDLSQQYQSHSRPLQQSRSFTQTSGSESVDNIMANPLPAQKATRSNRQSVHNGVAGISPGAQGQNPPVPSPSQSQQPRSGGPQAGDVGRRTPQPQGEELSEEEVHQLVKDHKELRDKYTKVKKYYFEKEDQVKQLQNSLAHQRLAQSRTSLDDSEYSTRFNRLDGLIAQLAFSIRKHWKTIPSWLAGSVNKDAVMTGKQEMTAAGRAFISCWLVEEVFDKHFHPDLDPTLSVQLKMMQRNIRKFAPIAQTPEEEEYLTAKVVNWRLTTLEGLQEMLRSPQTAAHRTHLIDILKENLIGALQVHLQDPPMSDLEGGVHMIIELAVAMIAHLPLESRDVVIEYFMPGYPINNDMMKSESGIPALGTTVAEDAAERMSIRSANSDIGENSESAPNADAHPRKRSMLSTSLSALTGTKKSHAAQGKNITAAGSSGSLGRPESAGVKDDGPPRVRMAVGLGAQVRGKSILVKAPVFTTA